MSKITLSEICRDLLLDRKNRALLVYSESCKKTLPDIYNFAKKHLDADANVIDVSLSSLTTKEIIIFNDMLQGVKADYFFPKIAGLKFPRRTSLILLFFLLEPFFP